jgi:predicted alpha-1,2-mannosidase
MRHIVLLFIGLMIISFYSCKNNDRNYIQYVNMLSGSAYPKQNMKEPGGEEYIRGGQVIPAVTYPFGMTQWTLQTEFSERERVSPFYSGKIRFQGFRGTHWLNGSSVKDYGSFTIFPTNLNDHRFLPHQRETMFMYNTETSNPAYISVLMPEQNIMTEITATKRCAIFTISWLDAKQPSVIFDVNSDEGKGFIKVDAEKKEIYGYNPVFVGKNNCKKPAGIAGYFVIKFNKDLKDYGTYSGMSYFSKETVRQNEKNIGAYLTFALQQQDAVILKVGTSFTSIENARANLEAEIPDWDFKHVRTELEQTWNDLLGRIDVETENKEDLELFYTSLYRSLLQPRLYSDVNGEYRGFGDDNSVHVAKGFEYYDDFDARNTYRAQMPLLSLITPREYHDMIKSLIVKAEQGGKMPLATFCNNYVEQPKGDYCSAIIADAFVKGFDFDIEKAYGFMRKNAFESEDEQSNCFVKGRPYLRSYMDFGYIPVDAGNSAGGEVTLTLDYSYNDYCLSEVAKGLGKKEDQDALSVRSFNYTNLFNPDKQIMCGKYSDDRFADDFVDDVSKFYIGGTPEQYTLFVPHDIAGGIELLGGEDEFRRKVDDIVLNNKLWPGNEPSQIIPYLYDFTGNWDKTQKAVRNILAKDYSTAINGYVRNDEGAKMSAWYVFSSMGFYPVCPVKNSYSLSSPLFDRVTITLDDDFYSGNEFVIRGEGNGKSGIYSGVKLDGKKIKPFVTFENLKTGGELVFSR